jgi:nucleolar protein 14
VELDAFEELFDPLLQPLEEIDAHGGGKGCMFSPATMDSIRSVLDELGQKSQRLSEDRVPVTVASMNNAPSSKQYNPRFEDSFVKGKDYDPDRQRAEERRLKKMLRKEERGAIRELRKDATFMAGIRDQEKQRLHTRLDGSAKRAIHFCNSKRLISAAEANKGCGRRRRRNRVSVRVYSIQYTWTYNTLISCK